jgi:hypothetical protein
MARGDRALALMDARQDRPRDFVMLLYTIRPISVRWAKKSIKGICSGIVIVT